MENRFSRADFLRSAVAGVALAGAVSAVAQEKVIQGFEDTKTTTQKDAAWTPISDRKIRVGIAGYGVCKFGAAFDFQNHPNVEIVAVTDLIPERCAELAKVCRCEKTYPSFEEMVKDDGIEAVFIATDAPSHANHAILALERGKHAASAVPAVFGSVEDAFRLHEAVKKSGLNYMMFETSCFHNSTYAMRQLFNAGALGKLIYSEGEYYHYCPEPIDSYKGWRIGLPPQWYPTHSNGYYTCVSGGSFTEVSCLGMPSAISDFKPENNAYKNPFGTEIALMRTSEGGMSRMAVSWDTPGFGGEVGRIRGEKGAMTDMNYDGLADISGINLEKPPLPASMSAGGHGGSHGYLTDEFVASILQARMPLVNVAWALNMTVAGIVSHESALKNGETLKIPQFDI